MLRACVATVAVASGLPLSAAAAGHLYPLAIPRLPLDAALRELAKQTGLQIGHASAATEANPMVGPLQGSLTAEEALGKLLSGHGLTFRRINERTFAILSKPAPPSRAAPGSAAVPSGVSGSAAPASGEVLVTARFKSESLQQTPLAITVLAGADMDARGFVNAARIASVVPNARFAQAQAAYGKAMTAYIRGVGQYDFHPAFEPGVGIYVDDAYHPLLTGSLLDLLDLERVEVLRGPQGTLFGRGAIGGVVRFVTRPPTGEGGGYVSATAGSLDRLEIKSAYDLALIEDKLFARVAASSRRRRGYQTVLDFACAHPSQAGSLPSLATNRRSGCVLGHNGDEDVSGARAAVRLIASDRLEVSASADYSNDDSGPAADTLLAVKMPSEGPFANWNERVIFPAFGIRYDSRFVTGNPLETYATFADPITGYAIEKKNSVRSWGLSTSASYDIDDTTSARLIVTERGLRGRLAHDSDGSPLNLQTIDGLTGYSGATEELRFNGLALSGALDWTTGLFNYRSTATIAQQGTLPAFSGASLSNDSHHSVDNSNQSVYVHTVYRATERLGLTGGLRYSRDRRDFHFNEFARGIFRDVAADGGSTDFRFGADYKLAGSTLLYGSVATGYKPGAFNPRPFQASQLTPVGGERLIAYELGAKSELLEGRLRANVAAFFSDYRRRIVSRGGTECLKLADGTIIPGDAAADPEHPGERCAGIISRTSYMNVPARIRGLELEIEYHPIGRLTVSGSGGLTDFSADELQPGSQAPYVPKYNASIALAYELGVPGGGKLQPRADYYLQSEICYARTAAGRNPPGACAAAYSQLDARVDYTAASGLWSTALGVTNLTAERFYYNILDLTTYGQPTIEGQPSRPREWYVSLSRFFQ